MVLWQHVMLCGNTLLRVQLARCASYEYDAHLASCVVGTPCELCSFELIQVLTVIRAEAHRHLRATRLYSCSVTAVNRSCTQNKWSCLCSTLIRFDWTKSVRCVRNVSHLCAVHIYVSC